MSLRRCLSLCFCIAAAIQAQPRNLEIYWTDVEGGASTLIVSPTGQSLLVDAGFPQNDRDAKRIFETTKTAGLKQIDMMITTHFHLDHVGGTPALSKLIPIEKYYDHGDSIEAGTPQGAQLYNNYKAIADGKRTTVKPGDKIPLGGVQITVVSAAGQVIGSPINPGGPNEFCKDAQTKPEDKTENAQSVGFLLTFGNFKFLDLGDLTWDREMMLACPVNKLGQISLFQASHHGFSQGMSGSPAMVWALKPQVVIVNDGARKGFDAAAYETISKIPGIEGIWQLHRVPASDAAHNTSPQMTANLEEGAADQAAGIKVSVAADGTFTVTNSGNNYSKVYTSH